MRAPFGVAAPERRVRVKVCGLTRPEDAAAAEAAGADALGVIFAARSRRCVDVSQARRVLDAAGPWIARVGVFVDAPVDEVLATVRDARLTVVQLHGREDAATVAAVAAHVPVVRARSWREVAATDGLELGAAQALLVDGPEPSSGTAFDWAAAATALAAAPRWILAGGLTPENVAGAIARLRPYGVDVASGVESAPGVKDPLKLRAFVAAARGG